MKNPIPQSNEKLASFAGDVANGLTELEASLEILQNPQAKIRAEILEMDGAIEACDRARDGLAARHATVRSLVDTSREHLTLARDNLKPVLGKSYNQAWDAIGLVRSLLIPRPADQVQRLLHKFKLHLLANPAHEVPSKDITAARFAELHDSLEAARAAVQEQKSVRDEAMTNRDTKASQLRKRMSDLIKELNMKLGPLDARWLAFGLNMPGMEATPGIPDNVTAVLVGPNAVSVKWSRPPRARYYRVWKRVVGVDEQFVPAGSPADRDITIEGLPDNSMIEIAVSAVNSGGESGRSAVATVTTH